MHLGLNSVANEWHVCQQGIWQDSQIAGFKRIVDFVHAHKGKIGIQLAHAGRKASTMSPWMQQISQDKGWEGSIVPDDNSGGWHDTGVPVPMACDREAS